MCVGLSILTIIPIRKAAQSGVICLRKIMPVPAAMRRIQLTLVSLYSSTRGVSQVIFATFEMVVGGEREPGDHW